MIKNMKSGSIRLFRICTDWRTFSSASYFASHAIRSSTLLSRRMPMAAGLPRSAHVLLRRWCDALPFSPRLLQCIAHRMTISDRFVNIRLILLRKGPESNLLKSPGKLQGSFLDSHPRIASRRAGRRLPQRRAPNNSFSRNNGKVLSTSFASNHPRFAWPMP